MIDPKKTKELASNLDEVLSNLDSVRGSQFANAVAAYFESHQLIEIISLLAAEANEDNIEYAISLGKAGVSVLHSITRKTLAGLSEADLAEVVKTGNALLERRQRLTEGG